MRGDRAGEAWVSSGARRVPDVADGGRSAEHASGSLPDHAAGVGWPHNLPAQLTGLVGREREVAAVGHLLPGTRLLTLTGAPGVGKTRLALEVAAGRLNRSSGPEQAPTDGVWLVELAPLTGADQVPTAVASVLGVRERPGSALMATLADALRPRRMLLVLDNCEHVVQACATLADGVLRACPQVRIIATSREALGIPGETTFPVPGLSLPEPPESEVAVLDGGRLVDDVLGSEAGRLFAERAQAALPTFRVSEDNAAALALVCRRLDGIPLALELAAARVTALTPSQLAQRLDDCFRLLTVGRRTALPRQQTLRATLDWSHDLLTDQERRLLRRLSVFAGGWSLEAAEHACADDELAAFEILALVVQLVEKSLILAEEQDGSAGYRLLDTVRQYGAEKLREAGEEAAVRDRHLAWFATVAEQAEDPLWSSDLAAWFARLTAQEDDLRAALEWSARATAQPERAAVEAGLRLGGALWHFWDLRGHLTEGRTRLVELLATGLGAPTARAKALHAAAYLTFVTGEPDEASRLAEGILALGQHSVHPFILASALVGLATGALIAGDSARATALCEDGLAACRRVGERRGMYYSLYGLAEVARSRGDTARAVTLMEEAHALTREQGDPWSVAFALSILGNLVLLQGDTARAATLQHESLALRQAIGDAVGIGRCLDGLGWVTAARGELVRAARLCGAAEALRERVGAAPHLPWRAEHERWMAAAWVELGEDAFAAAWSAGRALSLDEAIAQAFAADQPTVPSSAAPARPAPGAGPGGLSPRELEVALLIAQGHTNRRIAEELVIAEWTVDTHVRHILNKLGFRSRAQVAAWATERELTGAGSQARCSAPEVEPAPP